MRHIYLAIVCIAMLLLNISIYFRWLDAASLHFLALSTGLVFAVLTLNFIYELQASAIPTDKGSALATAESKNSCESLNALTLVSMLQEKGRLLDFVMDDVSAYSDAEVGQVARVVHQGVKEVLTSTLGVEPLHNGKEGETISISGTLDPELYKLIGTGTKKPPFSAKVIHKGWKTTKNNLPQNNLIASNIVQSIEIEVA